MQSSWRIPKLTGAYGDVLVAVGTAHLLDQVPSQGKYRRTVIRDCGDHYELTCNEPVSLEQVLSMPADPGYRFICFKSGDSAPPGATVFDYEAAREAEKRYREYQKATKKTARRGSRSRVAQATVEEAGASRPEEPPLELQVMKSFSVLRMGSNAYNNLHKALGGASDFGRVVARGLGLVKDGPSPDESSFRKIVSSLQFFNPVAGKGVNRAKPDGTSLGALPGRMVDWFDEWMRYRAMEHCLASWAVGDDAKIMVLAPGEIDVPMLSIVRDALLKARLWGSLSVDVRAALTIARELIAHSQELRSSSGRFRFNGRTPRMVVSGLHVAYFKNLGTASAVMNLSIIGIPGWFPIVDRNGAEEWLSILEEHEKAVRSLDENHSDEVGVLLRYRDFLSSGLLRDALDFFVSYDNVMMHKMAVGKYTVAFSTDKLRRLLMSYPSVREITDNPGFETIAAAVRRATIKAQIRKAKTGRVVFEIQYGLAQEWKRKAKHRDEFIKELADFVQRYNAETAKHAEQGKEMRPYVYTEHLDQLVELIQDDKSSELVGMLLLAYGYALESKGGDDREDK